MLSSIDSSKICSVLGSIAVDHPFWDFWASSVLCDLRTDRIEAPDPDLDPDKYEVKPLDPWRLTPHVNISISRI